MIPPHETARHLSRARPRIEKPLFHESEHVFCMSNDSTDLLPDGRADLLCFLVATAAASYALTQEWRVDHVVQNCRSWLARRAVTMHWLERLRLGQLALKIAEKDLLKAGVAVRLSSVQALFTEEMGLNYSSTMVQRMLALCKEAV
jgi:hypothetical protein